MTEQRIKLNNIVFNQLPSYVKEEFPLLSEFLSQYYLSQEVQSASLDLIQNIDKYIKLDKITKQIDNVVLLQNISELDDTIFVNVSISPGGTTGFPEKYGLLKINDEIITYTGKTFNSFTGCIRGFSGISSYTTENKPDQLVFSKTKSSNHSSGSLITNLSSLFLKQFLLKIKYQLLPGFENRELVEQLDKNLFIKQAKDFYRSKGTDNSFEILFKSLYNENVSIIRPKEYLFRPSDSQFEITKDLIIESIEGNPEELENSTLIQNEYGDYTKAYAPITKVEKILSKTGKQYYKLSIDSNYDRDITVDGALYGQFKIHPQTKVIGQYGPSSQVIDVDSTVGFPLSGELFVTYNNGSTGTIFYSSKSINQFLGCSNIQGIIEDSSDVSINTFANNFDESIKVRITGVLSDVDIVDDTFYLKKDYVSDIKTLGINSKDFISNNWLFNISPSYDVESISLVDNSNKTYRVNTKVNHIFNIGDNLKIKGGDNIEKNSVVVDVISNKSFIIRGQGDLLISDLYSVKKNILKANSTTFPIVSNFNANVQNIYKDKNKTLVASSSLPYYNNQPLNLSSRTIVFSGTFDSDTFKITSNIDHGFYTGDAVYYTPEKITTQIFDNDGNISNKDIIFSQLFKEGIYYIKRIDSTTVKFALSRTDIYNSKFISVNSAVSVNSNKIELYDFKGKTLTTQNLFREIAPPINDGNTYNTEPGFTGILINGVEILNYKSRDVVYHGELTDIEVVSPGQGYDIINPPNLLISDEIGIGASAYCSVKGSLQEIRIVDPGFDYTNIPVIKITGGNGIGAKAYANMKLIDHESFFNSEITFGQVSLSENTIGFSTFHKFRNAEKVIYNTDNQRSVGGLSTQSTYYVSVQSPTTIKLHRSTSDAVVGINTIDLTSFGIGNHSFKSFDKKLVLGSINIENPGFGYENKKRTVISSISGINTSTNQINIPNHDFKNGEIVKYVKESSDKIEIGGLVSGSEYYITVIDSNSFKLSQLGSEPYSKDFFYITKQFIDLTSIGTGIHSFNYPEISVEVIGNVGGIVPFKASVQPIFRGEITSVHLESGGVGYGSSEILNYKRQPTVRILSGSGAQVTPIIMNGKISNILVNSSGSGYTSPPDLEIIGDGFGAVLTPIIEDGKLIDVKIIESGIGYKPNNTFIIVSTSGAFAEFSPKIKTWNVNLFQKLLPIITEDDGILSEGLNEEYQLQFSHLYAPRKLREIIYANDQDGNTLYGKKDLRRSSNKEINSTDHSPIIGWAYDGNPIYGPYGYLSKQGGTISQMKSGYRLDLKNNRPSLSSFPEGFFVEDYTYFSSLDETVLDDKNGRFCVTPEFPNGTYAYFCTLSDSSADSSGTFSGYKRPVFPYFIGNAFKSKPNEFNFKKSSNQLDIDLNETKWVRNTEPYNLIENGKEKYDYLELPNLLNQSFKIKYASPGSIENISVNFGGSNYKVGDKIVFDNEGTQGYNASAEVERISGKDVTSISVASTSFFNVEFYPDSDKNIFLAFTENPHSLVNNDFVTLSGFNTTSSLFEGSYQSGVKSNVLTLKSNIPDTSVTGIVTYFSVSGNINFPNIRENDIYLIGSEQVKILNVDQNSSRIRVLREFDNTVGSSHTVTDLLYEVPRKLSLVVGIKTQYDYKINKEIYFDPKDSLGIGTISGINTSIVFSNPGSGITSILIPTQSIYIPNHQLSTGDELIYSSNGEVPIGVSTDGISSSVTIPDQTTVYVAKLTNDLIGISTFRVGLGTNGDYVGLTSSTNNFGLLYFTHVGSGQYHSFKTKYNGLVGKITKNEVTVSTAQTHGLLNDDKVFVNVNPLVEKTFIIKYDDYNRKLLINPKQFDSSQINTQTNTITINNHEFTNGQKVVYTSNNQSNGLENNKEYFILVIDNNNIRLTNSFFESTTSKPIVVQIDSSDEGTLSLINPPINVYKDSSIIFDLTDSSLSYVQQSTIYPAFDLNFFKDPNFTESYVSNGDNSIFEVNRVGIVGVTSDAKVILNINEKSPENLYYNLIPVYEGNLPENKRINVDTEVLSNNKIILNSSIYNGEHIVSIGSSNSFTYTISDVPEEPFYSSNNSIIKYETDSINSKGSISKVKILNRGLNYYTLPKISNVNSIEGKGSLLDPSSKSIGKIKTTRIKNIGFNFPSDFTVRPSISIPQILRIDPLSSLESVGISSFGRGYISPPKLLVLDGKTKKVSEEIDLKFTLGNNKVEILQNSFGLNNVTPIIIPTQNSNGVGISSISYNSLTKEVLVNLSVGFSELNSFPFSVNDKVLIENINVLSGKGFNSENYDYQLFTITSINPNIGGFGSVTYSLDGIIKNSESPGIFDPLNSSGRIIPEKYFPIFDVKLKENNYLIYEKGISESSEGRVEDWDSKLKILKVVSKDTFKVGELFEGTSSNTKGVILSVDSFDAFFNINSTSKFENGWKRDVGYLNDNNQRIQDSLYYQNFSYSLKSKVDYDTWNDVVSTLNHTSGFKKFSDYQLESNLSPDNFDNLQVKVPSNITTVDIITDVVGVVNLNCVYDFDLVRENAINVDGRILSDEIIFSNRVLIDYSESVGNRVLSIDDISNQFNSNPRPTRFSEVHRFNLDSVRAQKYITYVRDKRFTGERQLLIVTTLIDEFGNTYLNQYGRIETTYDMGSFDLKIDGSEGVLLFYPNKFSINDFGIVTLSYNIGDSISGIGSTNFGNVIDVKSNSTSNISESTTIVGISTAYRSCKVLALISANNQSYEFDELTLIHDGNSVEILEYGQLTDNFANPLSQSGLGTYYAYISGSQLNLDFIPNSGISATINTISILFGDNPTVGIGTYEMKHAKIEGRSTNIEASIEPISNIICEIPNTCDMGYIIVQISDLTNNIHQISEIALGINDDNVYFTEYGIISTNNGVDIGTISAEKLSETTVLTFTPIPNIDVNVKVYSNSLRYQDDSRDVVSFLNSEIQTDFGTYEGTNVDIKKDFYLTHKNNPIFERYFDGSNQSIVDINNDTIFIPNHFFVTGELVKYYNESSNINNYDNSIGIAATSFAEIGITNKLPENLYVIKVDNNKIKFARSAEDALLFNPKALNITSVGIGTIHKIVSTNQNSKVIIAIDNLIQSPIVSTDVTTILNDSVFTTDNLIYLSDVTSFFGGDLIRIGNEIMKIEGVGIGSTNAIRVRRPLLGTVISEHPSGFLVTKISGNYNITDNVLNFIEAPYGNVPLSTTTNSPDERDWTNISVRSKFHGRSFIRSGLINSTEDAYYSNYIFEDISSNFNGINKQFELKSNNSNVTDIVNKNAIILINDIFQSPGLAYDYNLLESGGVTSINFTGNEVLSAYDINNSNVPRGGIIVSVGSTDGFGYQPLVSAGGTAIVSTAGTISSISIGNSGSGYRGGIQIVNVSVGTSSTGIPNIEFIGTATVSNGHIIGVNISNPGSGYTFTNPPYVIFDSPLSYSNIPLIYSSESSGIGTEAKIDIVVSENSNIIDFEITNTGYGYNEGEVLTIPIGGSTGIPTIQNSPFEDFKIFVKNIKNDKFAGWTIGELQVFDRIDDKFDGIRSSFPLTILGNLISIRSSKGSNINIQDTLLVFINNILQEPGKGYLFNGGSIIRFTEPPKVGDTSKILFYRGSGIIDVVDVDILETVKIGDELTIGYNPFIGQLPSLQQEPRTVTSVNSTDIVSTNPYFGPGNTEDENLERPVKWCRQTEDKIINEQEIGKDRILYNSIINPISYLIQPVGVNSTIVYVDTLRPLFNQQNESSISLSFQNKITLISQESKVGASATAIVDIDGSISSIDIIENGFGYIDAPLVSIQNPIGIGTRASATSSISSGIVTSINITNSGFGYTVTNPPVVLIEYPSIQSETNEVTSYEGDSGIIVGFGTTTIGSKTKIILDLYIPQDSFMRQESLTGVASTVSSLDTGDYFVVYNSNVGSSSTSIISKRLNTSIIGLGTEFIDNVYQVESSQIIETSVVGVGLTYVNRILSDISFVNFDSFSSDSITFDSNLYTFDNITGFTTYSGDIVYSTNFGNFSWGKISLLFRTKDNSYNFYGNNGVGGISTSTIVKRTTPLKFSNYIVD